MLRTTTPWLGMGFLCRARLSELASVSRKSQTFQAHFGWQFSLYLQKKGVSRQETLQLFQFSNPKLQHVKRLVLQNKRVAVLRMAFRARKVFETLARNGPLHFLSITNSAICSFFQTQFSKLSYHKFSFGCQFSNNLSCRRLAMLTVRRQCYPRT